MIYDAEERKSDTPHYIICQLTPYKMDFPGGRSTGNKKERLRVMTFVCRIFFHSCDNGIYKGLLFSIHAVTVVTVTPVEFIPAHFQAHPSLRGPAEKRRKQ